MRYELRYIAEIIAQVAAMEREQLYLPKTAEIGWLIILRDRYSDSL
ncbi:MULTISPECIES: hypothetical protein [Calothrix]|uniref:Uncharacterized protein n=2 Tax=Calothrix TaxID=1186 RepID=A0ABR8A7V7_9CYAN|nr:MULTISPECIES: hypothetical protein [Calothrix]MBD2196077.1 hypothetical protein [Calothrix parietina FACHB-288]MBD2224727.1 hypothetical protein [Calothrix anomala FACHB-343]